MDNQARAEFRLKPGSLRRHNVATVGDVHDLLHRDRIESQSPAHLAAIDTTFQLAEATETTDEVDTLVRAEILDIHQLVEDQTAGDIYVEHADRIVVVVGTLLGVEGVPVAVEIE